jgi:hypothetical protein
VHADRSEFGRPFGGHPAPWRHVDLELAELGGPRDLAGGRGQAGQRFGGLGWREPVAVPAVGLAA